MFKFQGDILRNSLLTRYFGKQFIQKQNAFDLRMSAQRNVVTHGPGGKNIFSASGFEFELINFVICQTFGFKKNLR